jgi:hypothetical protein
MTAKEALVNDFSSQRLDTALADSHVFASCVVLSVIQLNVVYWNILCPISNDRMKTSLHFTPEMGLATPRASVPGLVTSRTFSNLKSL